METGKSFVRRDKLLEIEAKVRVSWEQSCVFKAESNVTRPKPGKIFVGTFPFPFMNGTLRLGHAFSLSKLEFASAYHRLRGANVLLPFAFTVLGCPLRLAQINLFKKFIEDLKAFGFGCDWRRTFITADINPFYNSFIRWQMRKLKDMGKIVKDLRYAVYSPLDGQPCADHDRALVKVCNLKIIP
ncbi:hypothetical protein GIB67_018224 [Kingdonia uniflora]|uniref:Uncharacterized protein n=1 Tax=Kingdonia uniflora TaxID=39325 RepID=A0A7J7NN31_9MAGN|nr:hypothetical protein GIB67_018224 [Kingdonia uniflora]